MNVGEYPEKKPNWGRIRNDKKDTMLLQHENKEELHVQMHDRPFYYFGAEKSTALRSWIS